MWSSKHPACNPGRYFGSLGFFSSNPHQPWLGLRSTSPISVVSLSLLLPTPLSLSLSPPLSLHGTFTWRWTKKRFYIMYKSMVWIVSRILHRITFILQPWRLRMDMLLNSML
ncbi:hypothetical protein OIU79_030899 [Salix purpurea]|uniref:Uncharacterized protein n=1 Tax=Salix purpurea TaxID=77065 RepID=A0A9Q0V9X4_SALPP|nr:hypothetical protein OIU79_030899 [Salix purpurea]